MILKWQRRFGNEKHIVCTEEVNKIALSANDDKRMQSIDLIEKKIWYVKKEKLNVLI